jgi:hypothetical protein
MSNEPIPTKPASSRKRTAPPQPEAPAPKPNSHAAVMKAARDAEQAVVDSARSAGLVHNQ